MWRVHERVCLAEWQCASQVACLHVCYLLYVHVCMIWGAYVRAYVHARACLCVIVRCVVAEQTCYIQISLLQTAEVLVSVLGDVVATFDEDMNNNDTGAM